jgi:hypothetical protein
MGERLGSLEKLTIAGCESLSDPSGHCVYHVTSPHALMQAVGYLKHTAEPWERIYMRGQSRLYEALSPTLYRGISNPMTQGKRHQRLAKVIQEFCTASTLFNDIPHYAKEPLLQHYGIKTSWLDIVDNIWVALWFAIHRAYISGHEDQFMHFDIRSTSTDDEFAYILLVKTEDSRQEKVRKGVTKGRQTEVIDLRIAASSVFLRPHAQHGLLFRARGTEGGRLTDYAHTVAGIIRFPLEAGKIWLGVGAMHDVRSLFPPPFYDSGYRILLGVELTERSLGVVTHVGA